MRYRVFYAEKYRYTLLSPDRADIIVVKRKDKGDSGNFNYKNASIVRADYLKG